MCERFCSNAVDFVQHDPLHLPAKHPQGVQLRMSFLRIVRTDLVCSAQSIAHSGGVDVCMGLLDVVYCAHGVHALQEHGLHRKDVSLVDHKVRSLIQDRSAARTDSFRGCGGTMIMMARLTAQHPSSNRAHQRPHHQSATSLHSFPHH